MLFIGLLQTQQLFAHEGRPVFIELKERASSITDSNTVTKATSVEASPQNSSFELRWKIPPVLATEFLPNISLIAEPCVVNSQQQTNVIKPSLIGKKDYRCSSTPNHLAISISYPDTNPALSSLIVYYDITGESKSIFSGPEQQLVHLPNNLSAFNVAKLYIVGGIKHIAFGYDHLLFVVCLMFIAVSISRILLTVTGFTIGHSITLIVSSFNLISVPILFVEMLIALSIVVLAAEILRAGIKQKSSSLTWRYPIIVASSFGLLHGLGFASTLSQLGIPSDNKITAVLFFNLGIELGQIIFVVIIVAISTLLKQLIQSKATLQIGSKVAVYSIGVLASYWLFERFYGFLV